MVTSLWGFSIASLPHFLHLERQKASRMGNGPKAAAGVRRAGSGTDFVELSPYSLLWATPLAQKYIPPLPARSSSVNSEPHDSEEPAALTQGSTGGGIECETRKLGLHLGLPMQMTMALNLASWGSWTMTAACGICSHLKHTRIISVSCPEAFFLFTAIRKRI